MIKFEHAEVMNFKNALRGMRNPMNSHHKADSYSCEAINCLDCSELEVENCYPFKIGESDMDLALRLIRAGSDHRKFMRQIFVSVDITAPLYWWKEFDTYKVGTTANSTSTMHKIHAKPIELTDFSMDNIEVDDYIELVDMFINVVADCEQLRQKFVETKDKKYWRALIQLLPSSYNQTRTCTLTFENLYHMYYSRNNHKLVEWREFCEWLLGLPYAKELILGE